MKMLVLGSPESRYVTEIQQAARACGHFCEVAPLEQLHCLLNAAHETFLSNPPVAPLTWPLEDYEVCVVRAMPPGSLEQVIFRMDLLSALQASGVKVVNSPKAMECAIDKYLTLSRCRRAGLPVPETFCTESASTALEVFDAWGEQGVLKPLFGSEGRGILHLTDRETARRVFRAWEQIQAVIYLQKFIPNSGSDLRVLMLGGHAVGAIRRTATADFRTNCSLSGVASPHELTEEELSLAHQACKATGVDFGGVDLIRDLTGKLFLLEVNACPGWQAFQKVTGIPVAARLIAWLEEISARDQRISPAPISSAVVMTTAGDQG